MSRLIIIGILVFSHTTFASFNKSKTDSYLSENLNTFLDSYLARKKVKISKAQLKIAHNLKVLYEITNKGHLHIGVLKKCHKDVKGSKLFSPYLKWVEYLIKVSKTKSSKSLKKLCPTIKTSDTMDKFSTFLKNARSLCFRKYISILGNNSIRSKRKNLSFIARYIDDFTYKRNIDAFVYFLSQIKKSSKLFQDYGLKLSETFIINQTVPDQSILEQIYLSADFTRYMQESEIRGLTGSNHFKTEMRILVRSAFELANDNAEKSEVFNAVKEVVNFYNLSNDYLDDKFIKKHFIKLGKSLLRRGHNRSSLEIYNTLISKHTNDEELLFEKIWVYINNKNYKDAYEKVIVAHKLEQEPFKIKNERLKFWVGLVIHKIGYNTKANSIFKSIVEKSPLNFYAIISSKFLTNELNLEAHNIYLKLALKQKLTKKEILEFKLNHNALNSLRRIKLWSRLGQKKMLDIEQSRLLSSSFAKTLYKLNEKTSKQLIKKTLALFIVRILKKDKNYLDAFKTLYRNLASKDFALDKTVLSNLFPTPYYNSLKKYNEDIDPVIALSLIRQESGFNKKALSHAGARGLMQLMPNTAKRFKNVKASQLYSPKLNLKIGTSYLEQLYERYNQNLVYTLSAYNAGETRVKRWRSKYFKNQSTLHNIENIPFHETRKYVKLIFRNIFFYNVLSSEKSLNPSSERSQTFDKHLGLSTTFKN